jgi:hypothetical protein
MKPTIAGQSWVFYCEKETGRGEKAADKEKTNMKRCYKKLRPRFEPDTRFELTPVPPAPFRGTRETELEQFKNRLLRELLANTDEPELYAPLRRATNEAAALAWTTPFPLLVLPELLREKADTARRYAERQAALLKRPCPIINVAA